MALYVQNIFVVQLHYTFLGIYYVDFYALNYNTKINLWHYI